MKIDQKALEERAAEVAKITDVIHAGKPLAELIQVLDSSSDPYYTFTLEKTIDAYLGNKVKAMFPEMLSVYETLKASGYTEANRFDFNDADNFAFYIPHSERKVFCVEDQNVNYLFIGEKKLDFKIEGDKVTPVEGMTWHARRYWDKYTKNESEDKVKGIKDAIKRAESLERYSDNLNGNQYVHRPDLGCFKEKGFNLRHSEHNQSRLRTYGDCRDPGYVFSFDDLNRHLDRAVYSMPYIQMAMVNVRSLRDALQEE